MSAGRVASDSYHSLALQIETPSNGFPVWVTGQYIILLMGRRKKKNGTDKVFGISCNMIIVWFMNVKISLDALLPFGHAYRNDHNQYEFCTVWNGYSAQ